MTKKNLTITIHLLGITREAFNAYVSTLAQCTQVLVEREGAIDGAAMRIAEDNAPASASPSAAPASRSVLN